MFIGLSVASLFRGGVADGRSRLGGFFFPSSRACLRPFALQSGLRVPTVPGFRLRPAVGCPERRYRRGLSSFYPTSPVRSSVAWGDRKKRRTVSHRGKGQNRKRRYGSSGFRRGFMSPLCFLVLFTLRRKGKQKIRDEKTGQSSKCKRMLTTFWRRGKVFAQCSHKKLGCSKLRMNKRFYSGLGPGGRKFESCHPDNKLNPLKSTT